MPETGSHNPFICLTFRLKVKRKTSKTVVARLRAKTPLKVSASKKVNSFKRPISGRASVSSYEIRKDFLRETYELPSNYNGTRLTLLLKDPFWVFAYWEVASAGFNSLRERIGPAFERSAPTGADLA